MARATKRLTARTVATIGKPGLHADGDGLYLRVDESGAKRWSFLFRWRGKRTEMGLGRLAVVGLAEARELADDARKSVAKGMNPIEGRKLARAAAEAAETTFADVADEYIATHKATFRNEKHIAQWQMTLGDTYCHDLRRRPIAEVTVEDVLGTLKPLWLEKPETASRLRGRIERVLDAGRVRKLRAGENPARWKGNLDKLLAKPAKLTRGHHAAMPYADVPALVARLREAEGAGAAALRFTVLTVGRTGEVIGAREDEFDLAKKIWTVPAERMKAGREHRVPLVDEAVEIIRKQLETATSSYIFGGMKPRTPISTGTMTKALATAGGTGTVHGLRSSFRDWVSEETKFEREVAEAALAHVVGDDTERAYRRGDALAKRRKLMDAWSSYCQGAQTGNVVLMTRAKS